MADYVAARQIDHPLGSSIWAFQPGDSVPEANVKAYGYDVDDGAGPYVVKVGTKAADKAADQTPA